MAGNRTFHEQLREGRQAAKQTPEVMAVLLNMSLPEYQALEGGEYPDEETLKRLCTMMEWNFYDTHRLIINELIAPPKPRAAEPPRQQPVPPPTPAAGRPPLLETLGSRLRAVREGTGQSEEIISRLLHIDVETYQRLEAGEAPPDGLLRRISMVYNWNYHDLVALQRAEHARSFQPAHQGVPFSGRTGHLVRWRALVLEMEPLFAGLPAPEQERALAQLELIRDSLARLAVAPPARKSS